MSIKSLYEIREGVMDDHAFIMATFLRGLYYGSTKYSLVPKSVFMENYKRIISRMFSKGYAVHVACLRDDPSVILGYSIITPDYQTLVWVFVKKEWRKQGIAWSLVPKHPESVSHLTSLGETLLPKLKDCIFNPFKGA